MYRKSILRGSALILAVFAGFLMVPSCVITIQPGSDDNSDGSLSSESDQPRDDGVENPVQELQEALADTDPAEVNLATTRASLVGYALMGIVESQVTDPATVDLDTLMQLIEQYKPLAIEQANLWLAELDPTLLAGDGPIDVNVECYDKYQCDLKTSCEFAKLCAVQDCGESSCKPCPPNFDVAKLFFKKWCSYTCVVGKNVVGGAVRVLTKPFNVWVQICVSNTET
ncbi:MAG TPA: hypothetical protein VE093_35455 [Polyangiaceae bacterium]|jgi:hypothetical protein|nr:hypothetical protein [Polyangiaceae bacterium]